MVLVQVVHVCFEIFEHISTSNRIRLPRAIRGNGLLEVYNERAARGQMVLHLAEMTSIEDKKIQ